MSNEETIDINKIEDQRKIAESITIDIDQWTERHYVEDRRTHLGGSVIGKSCSRELWYDFRWAKKQKYGEGSKRSAGQMLRLFNRGHREEPMIHEYLIGIGCKLEHPLNHQIKISDVGGHFGGSLDNEGWLPKRYAVPDKVLFEYKTMNADYFNKTSKKGVKEIHPKYWSQMCVYGLKRELNYAVFVAICKNDDMIFIEVLKLDHEHGKHMIDKAGAVITARQAPPKIAMQITNFACKWCNFSAICHHDQPVEKNCRSCVHSMAAADGQWLCDLAPPENSIIPKNIIPVGCSSFLGID